MLFGQPRRLNMVQPTQWFDADDEDGAQVWDAGADGWFRRSLARFVEPELDGVGVHLTAEQRESVCQDVVQWFAARAADYVFWEDMDLYHPEFKSGGWRIDWPKVEGEACTVAKNCAMALLREEWKRGLARPAGETVEHFLAEIDVALYDREGNALPCPEEPAAWQLAREGRLSETVARRLYRLHRRIESRWPRHCVSCGTEFRGPQRHVVRCAKCRQAGRVAKST